MPSANGPLKPAHHLILLLLAEEPTHGVELLDRLDARSRGAICLNAGSLYRMIAQLVDGGLLEPLDVAVPPGAQGAPRKRYAVAITGLCSASMISRQAPNRAGRTSSR